MMIDNAKYRILMNCPYCNNEDTNVLESRGLPGAEGVRRRRQCKKCGKRFTTHEKLVNIDLKIIKKNGKIEQYDRDKVSKGVMKACYKRKISRRQIENLVDEIETKLLTLNSTVVSASDIGRMVLTKLKGVDELAYMRFASVYMDFENADDFKRFILDSQKVINLNDEI